MKTLCLLSILRLFAAVLADYFGGFEQSRFSRLGCVGELQVVSFLASDADPSDGAAVHWTIYSPYVEIGLAVRISSWLSFELSEKGE